MVFCRISDEITTKMLKLGTNQLIELFAALNESQTRKPTIRKIKKLNGCTDIQKWTQRERELQTDQYIVTHV